MQTHDKILQAHALADLAATLMTEAAAELADLYRSNLELLIEAKAGDPEHTQLAERSEAIHSCSSSADLEARQLRSLVGRLEGFSPNARLLAIANKVESL